MRVVILTTDNREAEKDHANPRPHFGTAPAALLQGFAHLPEAEIHVVSCVRQPVSSPEKIAPNIFYHSLVVPKVGWIRSGYLGCIRATRKKIKVIQPDLVHGQGTERDCAITAVFSGFPNVLTIHGNMRLIAALNRERPFSYNWLAARLEGFTLPRSDGVVCNTTYTREAVIGLNPRTWILPNAVDAGFFDIQNRPTAGSPPTGICVGNICLRKNQNNFIRALDSLVREKQFKMIFLGKTDHSPYSQEFLSLVRERPWCEYHGFVRGAQLQEYFRRAAFLVLPTLEDSFGMVIVEAMAAGVPVLASRVGGVPDLIEPDRTGLFCDPRQPGTFATGVRRLLAEPGLSARLAAAAQLAARARFHPVVIARRHLEIYREVLGQNAGSHPSSTAASA